MIEQNDCKWKNSPNKLTDWNNLRYIHFLLRLPFPFPGQIASICPIPFRSLLGKMRSPIRDERLPKMYFIDTFLHSKLKVLSRSNWFFKKNICKELILRWCIVCERETWNNFVIQSKALQFIKVTQIVH